MRGWRYRRWFVHPFGDAAVRKLLGAVLLAAGCVLVLRFIPAWVFLVVGGVALGWLGLVLLAKS
ncbi:MAG: hypothetical protein IRY95_09395 [Clostridia bacterium]|nr:hypothetical protein [Clostridia bacterium]